MYKRLFQILTVTTIIAVLSLTISVPSNTLQNHSPVLLSQGGSGGLNRGDY